jgi:hypothetical protein
MKWINVEDELPCTTNNVLVTNSRYCFVAMYNSMWGKWFEGRGVDDDGGGDIFNRLDNITHWMELPSPPTSHNIRYPKLSTTSYSSVRCRTFEEE